MLDTYAANSEYIGVNRLNTAPLCARGPDREHDARLRPVMRARRRALCGLRSRSHALACAQNRTIMRACLDVPEGTARHALILRLK